MKKKINHPNSIWLVALVSLGINFLVMFSASQLLASEEKNNGNSQSEKASTSSSKNSSSANANNNTNSDEKNGSKEEEPTTEMKPEFNFDLASNAIIEGTKNIQGKVEGASAVEFYLVKKGSISPEYYLGRAVNSDSVKWSVEFSSKQFPDGDYEIFAKIKNIYGSYKSGNKNLSIKNLASIPTCSSFSLKPDKITVGQSVQYSWNFGGGYDKSKTRTFLVCSLSNPAGVDVSGVEAIGSRTSYKYDKEGREVCKIYFDKATTPACVSNSLQVNSQNTNTSNQNTNTSGDGSSSSVTSSPTPSVQNETKNQTSSGETAQIKSDLAVVYEKEAEIKNDETLSEEEKEQQLVEVQKEKTEIKKKFVSRQEAERVLVKNSTQMTFEEKEKIAKIKEQFKEDSDGDGLPDFEEERIGTDIFSADTDRDGYLDGDEVKNGFDPLVAGSHDKSDKIIFEEPKEKGVVSPVYEVKKVAFEKKKEINESGEEVEKEGINLQGKALPNSFVTLYIYSSAPIVITVQADEDGNWQYLLDKELEDGEHQVYATVTDNTGKITAKSETFSFVKTAKAAEKIDSETKTKELMEKNASPVEKMQVKIAKFILIFSFISFFLAVGSIALFVRHREFFKKKIEEMKNNE